MSGRGLCSHVRGLPRCAPDDSVRVGISRQSQSQPCLELVPLSDFVTSWTGQSQEAETSSPAPTGSSRVSYLGLMVPWSHGGAKISSDTFTATRAIRHAPRPLCYLVDAFQSGGPLFVLSTPNSPLHPREISVEFICSLFLHNYSSIYYL